jgi:hypothetical protein
MKYSNMKFYSTKTIFFTLLFILQFTGLAQTFEATTSHTKIGIDDRFEITFTFSGEDVNGLKNFSPPDFKNFITLSGPNQSTSMQFINGAASASQSFTYILKGRTTGNFTIGAASVEYKGNTLKTNPIKIEVVKGSSVPNTKKEEAGISDEEISKNLFVRATTDKTRAYVGEQVTVTYKLYTRLNIASQMSISKLPQYQGFWAEELETSNNILFNTEVIDGKQYRVGVLKKAALFPTQAGELSVSPFELNVPVLVQKKKRSSSIFDDFFDDPFFRGETVNYNAKSNTIKINVIPLPEQDKPDSFNGAVGEFSVSTSLDKISTKTNEPISLKLNISGTGNIKLLDIPEINLPSGLEKYEPKVSEQINRQNKISGKKTIEYLLVPRTTGKKEIPSINFSYFNPGRKSFVSLKTQSYTIDVQQGDKTYDPGIAGYSKEDIKLLGEDIRFIKTSGGDIGKKSEWLLLQFGFWAAVGVPLIALVGLIAVRKRDEKLANDIQLLRYRKAQKVAKNRLKVARSLMNSNQDKAFYAEVSLALFGYLEDKLHIPKAEFTVERAILELQKGNVHNTLIDKLQSLSQKCEYVRFAPKSDGAAAMNEIYNELTDLIIDIEKSFSAKKYA